MIVVLVVSSIAGWVWFRRRRKARVLGRAAAREANAHERRSLDGPFWVAYPPTRWRRAGGRR